MISIKSCNRTIEGVRRIPITVPEEAGTQWKGVRHKDLIDAMFAASRQYGGFRPGSFRGWVSPDKAEMIASFALSNQDLPKGYEMWIGVCSSNSRRKSMKFYAGITKEAIPLVGSIFKAEHKRTTTLDLEQEVQWAFGEWKSAVRTTWSLVGWLHNTTLTEGEWYEILFRAGRRGIIPWTRLSKVDRAFRQFGNKTEWNLLAAFHEVNSLAPAAYQMERNHYFAQLLPIKN